VIYLFQTVHQDTEQKGFLTAELVLNRLMEKEIEKQIILPVSLVECESVKRI
jgi:DNA-binding LacI/PurR family transcriptional regulator